MYRIVQNNALNASVIQMDIQAPLVARKARPGQFVILRVDGQGERIPLTIAGCDEQAGTVRIIFQMVGATTLLLGQKAAGESIPDFVGPLGTATELAGLQRVCVVGGGVGCAIALPIAQALHAQGANVTSIIGFRGAEQAILQKDFAACSDKLILTTDDGSLGRRGNVTVPLGEMLAAGETFDRIFAIGPLVMMKYVVETARPYGVPVTVSMNPIMIDGTGMCGGCRLTLVRDGQRVARFACVDGPDFDGYEVDFDEAMARSRMYAPFERAAREHVCSLLAQAVEA